MIQFKQLLSIVMMFILLTQANAQKPTPFYIPPNKPANSGPANNDPVKYNKTTAAAIQNKNLSVLKKPVLSRIRHQTMTSTTDVIYHYDSTNLLRSVEYKFSNQSVYGNTDYLFYDDQNRIYMIVYEEWKKPNIVNRTGFSIIYYDNTSRVMSTSRFNTMNQKLSSTQFTYEGSDIIKTTTNYRYSPPRVIERRISRTTDGKNVLQYTDGPETINNISFLNERDPTSYLPEIYSDNYLGLHRDYLWYIMSGNSHVVRESACISGCTSSPGSTVIADYKTNEQGWVSFIELGWIASGQNNIVNRTYFYYYYKN